MHLQNSEGPIEAGASKPSRKLDLHNQDRHVQHDGGFTSLEVDIKPLVSSLVNAE